MSHVDEEEMEEIFCTNYSDFERHFESLMAGQLTTTKQAVGLIC